MYLIVALRLLAKGCYVRSWLIMHSFIHINGERRLVEECMSCVILPAYAYYLPVLCNVPAGYARFIPFCADFSCRFIHKRMDGNNAALPGSSCYARHFFVKVQKSCAS
jgi:hypothetical protein